MYCCGWLVAKHIWARKDYYQFNYRFKVFSEEDGGYCHAPAGKSLTHELEAQQIQERIHHQMNN